MLAGCYGDINVSSEFQTQGSFDNDSLFLYFFHTSVVSRPAKGISAFPDGGIPKILFKKATFSRYDLERKSLVTILDYGSMPWSPSRWKFNISLRDDTVAFMIEPVSGWEKELKWGLDSAFFQKFRYLYRYHIRNGDISYSEPGENENFTTSTVPISLMKTLTGDLKYSDWGIEINNIVKAGKKQMIKDITELKGNQEYRNAVIEALSEEMTNSEKSKIISDIKKFQNSLDDYERMLNREAAENTINTLERVID